MKLKLLQKLRTALLLVGLGSVGSMVHAQTYTFTNAGATGVNGPTQLQVTNAYASTSLANSVTVTGGIQSWSVPAGGMYKIEVYGANGYGVYGGKGAYMSGEFSLNANDVLQILVGQMGGCCNGTGTNQYGGGGGSFVVAAGNNPLIIAGGGGGGATFYSSANLATSHNPVADASITTSGKTAVGGTANGTGGTAGNGGNVGNTGGGGGGFLTDGGSSTTALAQGGKSFLNGGAGANAATALGGFGGGGGVSGQNNMRAGGGGGYSGGGGCGSSTTVPQIGGGGGSYNSGANQVNTDALGTGHGMVVITSLQPPAPCTFPPTAGTASATPNSNICGGANIALTLSGNSTGLGQTYQWEESFAQGGPYTPISGATSISYTIQATSSMYYRCVATCSGFTNNSSEAFVSVGAVAGTASAVSNTVCFNGTASFSVAGYIGTSIQWEYYDNPTASWIPIGGATTANYTVNNVQTSTDYRAGVSCNTPGGTAYSNTISITVINPSVTDVFPGSRCDAGPVTLAAKGSPGSTIMWYDAITAGNLLGMGGAYTTPSISSTTTYYAAAATGSGGSGTPALPAHGSNYPGNVRGMWFTAPVGFTITSLQGLAQTTGSQSIAVVKFAAPPPIYSVTTNAFTVLYLTQNNPTTGPIPVNIPVNAGDHIGLLAQIGTSSSYATPTGPFSSTIGGLPITIKRIGMQFPLNNPAIPVQALWEETGGAIGRVEMTYQIGCEGSRVAVNATITGTMSGTGLATGGTTTGANQLDGTTVNYNDGCNDKVATVVDAPGGNTLGVTSAVALTSASVQTFNGAPYVSRVFDIAPSSSGAATVTLYALQSEFTAYNSYVTTNSLNLPLLPTGPLDITGIGNIKITQFHGNALAGTTGPLGLYDASNTSFITSITTIWTGQYWAMTFPVTGFSGFFIHSGSNPLVIDLREISAVNMGNRNRVDWSTVSEATGDLFELQRSIDGTKFTELGVIKAKGEPSTYSYWDNNPVTGINHYRLKMEDGAGKFSYSKVVSAIVKGKASFTVEAYPNPANEMVNVAVYGDMGNNAIVTITDLSGKILRKMTMIGNNAEIKLNGFASGVYLMKYHDDNHSQTIKITKQ